MDLPIIQTPTDLKQLKKQIFALEWQIEHDTSEVDRQIHTQALETLREAEKALEREEG